MTIAIGLLVSTAALTSASAAAAQEPSPESERLRVALEASVPGWLDQADVCAISLALIEDGRVGVTRAQGRRRVDAADEVAETTVFEAASLSKPVFAWAVLQLAGAGALDLDEPLSSYLAYEDLSHDPRRDLVTARMVLSHTSGLPNWRPAGGRLEFGADPGSAYRYSGEGFVWLQRTVEHVLAEPLHAFMPERVFGPLGMTRSSYVWEPAFEDDFASGHDALGDVRPKRRPELGNAAWSLATTASDYARFLLAVLESEGLAPELRASMLTPQVDVAAGVHWGLGWGLQRDEDGIAFWHWGHNDGYRAYAVVYPQTRRGLVFFTNSDRGMSLLEPLVDLAIAQREHPALEHLDYEALGSPRNRVRWLLEQRVVERGAAAGVELYFELREQHPPEVFDAQLLASLGHKLVRTGRIEAALELLSLNTDRHADSAPAHRELARAFEALGDVGEARASYERALELEPGDEPSAAALRRLAKDI